MGWKILIGLITALIAAFMVLLSQMNVTPGILMHALFGEGVKTPSESILQRRLELPEGFSVGLYAGNIKNARFIEFSRSGDLLVAQPRENKITLLKRDANKDGKADGEVTLMNGLFRPHSIDFFGDYLYIAESHAIGRIRFDHVTGTAVGAYEQIITGLADSGNHWTKTIRFGPDGMLYLSSGSTCNVCEEEDPQRAAITRYEPDGSGEERFSTGLRNSVGFDWAPFDDTLYATDNGRDLLGDDYPVCELNKVELGNFYGWPYVNGFGDLDPDFGDQAKLNQARSPVHGFRAHTAPLGIRFINSETFPAEFKNAALVALHGSWNRSTYDGYAVVSLHHQKDGSFVEKDFLTGFEIDGKVMGRPVDIAQGPDSCVYVSDDYAMSIYRVCYGETQSDAGTSTIRTGLETGLAAFSETRIAELSARGEHLFKTRGCTGCHGVTRDRRSFGLRPLEGIHTKYTLESLSAFYRTPTPPMPPVRLGNDEDELALSTYLLTLD